MTLLRTLLFSLLVPGTVAGIIPYLLTVHLRLLPPLPVGPFRYVGAALMGLGVLIYVWCAAEFTFRGRGTPSPSDPPRDLVVTGLYRYSRNPMYVGIGAIVLGVGLFFGSTEVLLYAALILLAFHLRIIHFEEPVLERTFGAGYEQYRQSTPRWLGRPR